jgi:transcriptional regulator with XRE-family HTH domain
MSNSALGKRLAQLRNELACPGEAAWSQARLAEETGLTPNQIARLEQAGAGGIDTLVKLLTFYHSRGYSLSWILLPDNTMTSKMGISETAKSVEVNMVLARLSKFKELIGKEVDDFCEELAS